METFLKKYNEIKSSWKNLIFKDKEIEKLAEKRATICANCDTNKLNFCDPTTGGCGCFIPAKIRGENNKCPKLKW
jgi:hypothetical protein